MLNVDTRRKIDSCRDILVGKLPDPKAQIEQITYALIYKFMADMDTASVALGGKASFFVNGYEQYTWDKLMSTNLGGKQRLDLYSEAIAKLSLNPHLPQLFRDIFKDAFLPYRDPETLNMFLKEISWFTYAHSEDLGDAFEYLLSVMSSQGDAGQFRTPRHIIDFIVAVVDPKKDETILDPACGTAGFLISSYKHILQQNTAEKPGDKLTPDEKQDLMNQIVGYDISPDMVRLSLVNMYLHGFPEPHIYEYDTLTDEGRWEDSFDVIMANPPFMSPKGGIRPHKRFSIQANRSEVLFVDYIAEHLMPNGRAGVIVPEGIIFQSGNAYKSLRKMLVDNYLFCVVSLPAGVFNPYSGVKTSILFMDKTLAKQTDNVLFVKIVNDGFGLGAQRREIAGSDFPRALTNIKTYRQSARNSKVFSVPESPDILLVSKQQLAENGDYNLSLERYRNTDIISVKWPMVELGSVVEILDSQRKPVTKDDRKPGRYPYYGATGIVDYVDDYIFDAKLVLIGEDGAKWEKGEKTAFSIEGKTWVNNHAHVLRPIHDKLLDVYLVTVINEMDLFPYITGVTVPKLTQAKLREMKIPLPPLNIQQEIVAEIESYQKIIDGARQVVSNYKPQIKIDPEWPLVELGSSAKIKGGFAFNSSEFVDHGIQVIRMGNIEMHNLILNKNPVFIPQARINEFNKFILKKGDVIITMTGTQGKRDYGEVAMIKEDKCYLLNQRVGKIEIISNDILPEYLLYILSNPIYQDEIFKTASGIRQANISGQQLENILIPLPNINVQQEIVAQIEKEQQLVDANKQLIQIYEQKIKSKIAEVWET
jgi:type I restriction enzyme M protein